MKMKRYCCAAVLCGLIYVITVFFSDLPLYLLWLKYASFSGLLFYSARYGFSMLNIAPKKAHPMFYMTGIVVMLGYLLLCLDTFVFHAWLSIPGLYRYAVFDFYLLSAPLFLLSGVCIELHKSSTSDRPKRRTEKDEQEAGNFTQTD